MFLFISFSLILNIVWQLIINEDKYFKAYMLKLSFFLLLIVYFDSEQINK